MDSQLGDIEYSICDCLSYLFWGNWLLAGLVELFDSLLIITQILLATDEDDGEATAEMQNLGNPL
jgi:hypothetical protein